MGLRGCKDLEWGVLDISNNIDHSNHSNHRFFEKIGLIQLVKDSTIVLSPENSKHISIVMRLKMGDEIIIIDGNCSEFIGTILEITKKSVTVSVDINSKTKNIAEPETNITIFQAIPKAEKMDFLIQKCVELGVSRIVPFVSERTIVKFDKKTANTKMERFAKISESAAKQSKRGIIPVVTGILFSINEVVDYDDNINKAIAYELEHEKTKSIKSWIREDSSNNLGIIIGPEGGFTKKEIDICIDKNVDCVTLGKRILRAETAGMAAAAYILYEKEL